MTRVLVVHHNIDIADQEADALRRAGYEVDQCAGPTAGPCPVMRGLPCAMADRADVLLYDVWAAGDSSGGRSLIQELRRIHPEIPVILAAPGMELDWVDSEGPYRVTPLVGAATAARLTAAIQEALATASPAESTTVG